MAGELLQAKQIIPDMEANMKRRVDALVHPEEMGRERIMPQLAILINNTSHEPSRKYVSLKAELGAEVGVAVQEWPMPHDPDAVELERKIEYFNAREDVHAEIVQLPLLKPALTDHVVGHIAPEKDVDGLGPRAKFTPVTPQAIKMLMDSYGIDYKEANVVLLGKGRLVGNALLGLLKETGASNVEAYDIEDPALTRVAAVNEADIIISSMGAPGALTPDLFESLSHPRVLIDAGTSEQGGTIVGDMSPELRSAAREHGWSITPRTGGIGPLTVHALLSNVITAAERVSEEKMQENLWPQNR